MESDEAMMARVIEGDRDALNGLIDRYSGRLYAYLVRYLRSVEDAEDALQETWIRVARSARKFDRSKSFRSWVYAIATNLGRDQFRRQSSQRSALSRMEAAESIPKEERLQSLEVRTEIESLPALQREVVLLRYFEGMDEGEMASCLGIARGTVKSRLHSAIARLRKTGGDSR